MATLQDNPDQAHTDTPPPPVLAAFDLDPATLAKARSGLINRTWHARSTTGRALVLQRLNAIFPAEVNTRIDALTRHLAAQGLTTPLVVPTREGALWYPHATGIWRVLTEIDGVTREAIETAEQAHEAGRILGAFHRAAADLGEVIADARAGVHDTAAHFAALRSALARDASHRHHAQITQIATAILSAAQALPALPTMPRRVVHGDPKISNIVFERHSDRALCLIDLDTIARMPIAAELGDAFRSWCHPGPEDAPTAAICVPLFEAAVRGYARETGDFLTEPEWRSLVDATLAITLELAARFCRDALEERYFGWNAERFPHASAHNQTRARCQLQLAESIRSRRVVLQAILEAAFAPQYMA